MSVLNTRLFDGKEYALIIYNAQAAIDKTFYFYYEECGDKIEFDFTDFQSGFFRVYNERMGKEIKDLPLTQNGSYLFLNASVTDLTFEDLGNYYYEIGYSKDGYEAVLRYGILTVI